MIRLADIDHLLGCLFGQCASTLNLPTIVPVKGLQIAKTKLSVRKAEKRHGKKGQERRKETPQTPAIQSIDPSSGDEVSQY
jgi:hypothetical protein